MIATFTELAWWTCISKSSETSIEHQAYNMSDILLTAAFQFIAAFQSTGCQMVGLLQQHQHCIRHFHSSHVTTIEQSQLNHHHKTLNVHPGTLE
jgi:hypothetical protein